MAFDTKDWEQLYEGAREVFGAQRAAIFMRAMEPSLREDLATKSDLAQLRLELKTELSDLRVALADGLGTMERQLRAQTWKLAGLVVAAMGLAVTLARLV